MDENVIAAMAKWPDVPAVYGWLGLSARGEWRIKGEPIPNESIRAFIARNYDHDAGRWFFQNGPQRVFVALEMAPYVYRCETPQGRRALIAHTGAAARSLHRAAWIIDGPLIVDTDVGPGNIDDRDSAMALAALCDDAGRPLDDEAVAQWLRGDGAAFVNAPNLGLDGGVVPLGRLTRAQLGERFGFDPDPRPN